MRGRAIVVCAANDGLFGVLCTVLGCPQLVDRPPLRRQRRPLDHRDALARRAGGRAGRRAGGELAGPAVRGRGAVQPDRRVGEALDSAQAAARRMVVTAGGLPMPGNPMKIAPYPDPADRPGPPELDEHGPAVRAELGRPR